MTLLRHWSSPHEFVTSLEELYKVMKNICLYIARCVKVGWLRGRNKNDLFLWCKRDYNVFNKFTKGQYKENNESTLYFCVHSSISLHSFIDYG